MRGRGKRDSRRCMRRRTPGRTGDSLGFIHNAAAIMKIGPIPIDPNELPAHLLFFVAGVWLGALGQIATLRQAWRDRARARKLVKAYWESKEHALEEAP